MIEGQNLSARESSIRKIAAFATLLVGFCVLAIKFWAYHLTHSMAVYSDAAESIVNVITAVTGIAVIAFASQPVDEDHPYGHGKIEYVSAAFEGGLITFAAIIVIADAIHAQLHSQHLYSLITGLWLVGFTIIFNSAMGLILLVVGKRYPSPALHASGMHLLTDCGTTAGAIIGIALVKWTGLEWVDRVVAAILGLWMAYIGLQLVRKSASGLLDAEDKKLLEQLAQAFEKFSGDGIIQIHHARIIRSGWFHHIDAHVVVPEFWTIAQSHTRLDQFEAAVFSAYEYGGDANFHLDPCKRKYCASCDYPDCPVRVEKFVKKFPVVLEHLRATDEPL